MAGTAYTVSLPLLLWMAPVILGLLLAVPIAILSSTAGSGIAGRRPRLFGTPEQASPPQVLIRANELANASRGTFAGPMHELRNNPDLLDAHLRNLSVKPRHRGQIDPHLAIARAKIEDAESFDNALGYLSPREIFAVLNSRAILEAFSNCPRWKARAGSRRFN